MRAEVLRRVAGLGGPWRLRDVVRELSAIQQLRYAVDTNNKEWVLFFHDRDRQRVLASLGKRRARRLHLRRRCGARSSTLARAKTT